jgi:hypothetical protein
LIYLLALRTVYPEYNWGPLTPEHFKSTQSTRLPKGFWKDVKNQRAFVEELASKLGITQLDDWYKVTTRQFVQHGGGWLTNFYKGSLKKGNFCATYLIFKLSQ